jgi:hypothetical protein
MGCPASTSSCLNDEVNANAVDTLTQTVSGLVVGQSYVFSWEYGGRNSGGPQVLDVSFGSMPLVTDTSDGVHSFWTLNSFTVMATPTSENLVFASQPVAGSAPSYGNELTNVSLTLVPEPATWALMLVGFGGMGAALRRRPAAVTA